MKKRRWSVHRLVLSSQMKWICYHRSWVEIKIAREKFFQGFSRIRTCGLCVPIAVLYQLSYEDPYTGPIYSVRQPVKGLKHRMKWCELQNLSNCKTARKKFFRASMGFEPMASVFALQCSTSWAMKTYTLEAGQFIEFINPWKEWNTEWNDVNCGNTNEMNIIYVTIAVESQFKQLQNSLKKNCELTSVIVPHASPPWSCLSRSESDVGKNDCCCPDLSRRQRAWGNLTQTSEDKINFSIPNKLYSLHYWLTIWLSTSCIWGYS